MAKMFTFKGRNTDPNRPPLSKEDFEILKKRLKERKKKLKEFPLFKMVLSGHTASLATPKNSRIPLSLKDIQCLLLCGIAGILTFRQVHKWFLLYQWKNISQTVVVVVENVSVNNLEDNQDLFPKCLEIFDDAVEMVNPQDDGSSLSCGLAFSPLSNDLKSRIRKVYSSLQQAFDDGHIYSMLDLSLHNSTQKAKMNTQQAKKGCSKLDLLLSPIQLAVEGFPLPFSNDTREFVFTKDKYEPVTENSPMFAIDCEWCACVDGSNGLARVAIVDENLDPVYHTFVRPDQPIKDYLTKWSGITSQLLQGVTKRIKDVQEEIRKLLPPDAIIVGHSVHGDLYALEMMHPYIIDTSLIYNLSGCRFVLLKLQFLASAFCNREIQLLRGHDPNEDAAASMELALLKLEMGLSFGDVRFGPCETWEGVSKERIMKTISNTIFATGTRWAESVNEYYPESESSDLDMQGFLYMKFFKYVEIQKESSALITHPNYKDIYMPKSTGPPGLFPSKMKHSKPFELRVEKNLQDAFAALSSQIDKKFLFLHTKIDEEKEGKEHLKELDKAIGDVYDQMLPKGMLIVIFGGKTSEGENGLCMVRLKKPRKEEIE